MSYVGGKRDQAYWIPLQFRPSRAKYMAGLRSELLHSCSNHSILLSANNLILINIVKYCRTKGLYTKVYPQCIYRLQQTQCSLLLTIFGLFYADIHFICGLEQHFQPTNKACNGIKQIKHCEKQTNVGILKPMGMPRYTLEYISVGIPYIYTMQCITEHCIIGAQLCLWINFSFFPITSRSIGSVALGQYTQRAR